MQLERGSEQPPKARCALTKDGASEIAVSEHDLNEDAPPAGGNGINARTIARTERRFCTIMGSIARANANASPDVSLELANAN